MGDLITPREALIELYKKYFIDKMNDELEYEYLQIHSITLKGEQYTQCRDFMGKLKYSIENKKKILELICKRLSKLS